MKVSELIEELKKHLVDGNDPDVVIEVSGHVHMERVELSTSQMEHTIKLIPRWGEVWIEGWSL